MPHTQATPSNIASPHRIRSAKPHPLARALAHALPGALLLSAGLLVASPAQANNYQVLNTQDSGAGSLREAIDLANANPGPDTITFASSVSGSINLTSGPLYIYDSVDVQGPGADTLTVNGSTISTPPPAQGNGNNGQSPSQASVFLISPEGQADVASRLSGEHTTGSPPTAIDVTIGGLTITGGNSKYGGGIAAVVTHLTVKNCVISNNTATMAGGGVFGFTKYGSLNIEDSVISNNTVTGSGASGGSPFQPGGGGIASFLQDTTIMRSTVSGNAAPNGGGILAQSDYGVTATAQGTTGAPTPLTTSLAISNSTITGNQTNATPPDLRAHFGNNATTGGSPYGLYGVGGGALSLASNVTIDNSTISGNNSGFAGGGLALLTYNTSTASIDSSTISGNYSAYYGGGLALALGASSNPAISDTVIGGNSAAGGEPDSSVGSLGSGSPATAVDLNYSLVQVPATSGVNDLVGNIFNQAPMLGALANNGGPTMTQLPLSGSPLIDAGDPGYSGAAFDQRGSGFSRIVNGRVDIGATEFGAGSPGGAGGYTNVAVPGLGWLGKLGLGGLLGLAVMGSARRRRKQGPMIRS